MKAGSHISEAENDLSRRRFKRKKSKKLKSSHREHHFSASQNIYFVSKTLSEPYLLTIPHLVFLFHFTSSRSTIISHQEMVAD